MRFAGILIVILSGCSTVPTSFSPTRPIPAVEFSHQTLNELLRENVRDGYVDYPSIEADGRLDSYIASLDHVDPNSFSSGERLAVWINSYNAFAIKGILDRYSPMTLWGRYQYFIVRKYRVGGKALNLYDLERGILIPFREPRIHFAIVCASLSCPKLQSWAYGGDRLEEQLTRVTRAFVNDPSRNRFDRDRKIAYLSKIFDWFRCDFETEAGSLQRYVQAYIDDPDLARDFEANFYTIRFLEYDWHLNGTPPGKDKNVGPS